MKVLVCSALVFFALLQSFTVAQVSSEQLGKLMLGDNYSIITQEYLAYYSLGPTSATTYGGYHPGIDYRAQTGTLVYSPVTGVVHSTNAAIGRVSIRIDGTNDYFIMLHLSRFQVQAGTRVSVGDTVGLTGSAGASAPHLHVELRTERVAAAYYFRRSSATGYNKNPGQGVTLDLRTMTTFVFNQLEIDYPWYFPVSLRLNNTTYFDGINGYRWYRLPSVNYLYHWNGTIWYRIDGQWYDSQWSAADWYYWLGGL
jgi:murein DD-endopeptidase MepM/ murein hydrolase activator NlpD